MKITKAEKMMMESIDKWIRDMKYFTDAQYGKGEMKALYRKVADEIMSRDV